MTAENFAAAFDFAMRPENDGQPFHITPGDRGGATAWGVTYRTWAGWQQAHNATGITLDTFEKLERNDVAPIYHAWLWQACACDLLPNGIDVMTFDFACGSGPGTSAKMLQRTAGVEADGAIGPVTLEAIKNRDPAELLDALYAAQKKYLIAIQQPQFEHGWLRRRADCYEMAKELLPGVNLTMFYCVHGPTGIEPV